MVEPKEKTVVAVFDFDGTITYADSLLPFLRHVAGFFGFWLGMFLLAPPLSLYAFGAMANWQAKEKFMGKFLRRKKVDTLEDAAADFVKRILPALINPLAMERVKWHQGQGHRMLLLSASPELYLRHWASENGFEKVLGTRLEEDDGGLTGKIDGRNCHGEEKLIRLRKELGDLGQYEIYSYGDSRADKVLLNNSDHGAYRSFEADSKLGYRVRGLFLFIRALL